MLRTNQLVLVIGMVSHFRELATYQIQADLRTPSTLFTTRSVGSQMRFNPSFVRSL
jgi:hypothetical protein